MSEPLMRRRTPRRPMGWILDLPGNRPGVPFGSLRRVRSTRSSRPSMSDVRGKRIRQAGQSCVGQAAARCLQMCMSIEAGRIVENPSGLHLYTTGRRQKHKNLKPPLPELVDIGSFPHDVLRSCQRNGFVEESVWPNAWDKVDVDPPPPVNMQAIDQDGIEWAWIPGDGVDRCAGIDTSLQDGFPVMYGTWVDPPYEDHLGSGVVESLNPEEFVGRHMQTVLARLPDGNYLVDNWWDDWGMDDGTAIVSADVIGGPYVDDVYQIRSSPQYSY